MAELNFDANSVPDNLLPDGTYHARVVESEMRLTSAGTGRFLWLMLEIIEGPHEGRKLFDRMNLENPSSVTVEIAQRQLRDLCRAVGKLQVIRSEELHDIPLTIRIRTGEAKNGWPAQNTINYVARPDSPTAPAPATSANSSGSPSTNPASTAQPWRR